MTNPTPEQQLFVDHAEAVFLRACPGGGKTRTIVRRVERIFPSLPPRKGIAVLSFTNSAIDEFASKCRELGCAGAKRHPNFVDTFDGFLRHFFITACGLDGVDVPPVVVDSWDSLGIEIRLRGKAAFRGPGVSLDRFDPRTGAIDPSSIGHNGLRAHVQANRGAYEQIARQSRQRLRVRGYVSANDVRVEVDRRLNNQQWSASLGRAIAARFVELIVDEAQDCNPLDLTLLRWLRDHGVKVTVVTDLDQAIYAFRQGDVVALAKFGVEYGHANNLEFTGNFRSSPAICRCASTLRTRSDPDEALGENANVDIPIFVLKYDGASPPPMIHAYFNQLCTEAEIAANARILLAHARATARAACGLRIEGEGGESRVARLARAVANFNAKASSGALREASLATVERGILELLGKNDSQLSIVHLMRMHGMNRRWLRRTALQLITALPASCDDSEEGRARWVGAVRAAAGGLELELGSGITINGFFRNPPNPDWSQCLLAAAELASMTWATIHEAKGSEHEAVCVVIPPSEHTSELVDAWEARSNIEALRVVYVGVTRAEKLLALAIPAAYTARVIAIFQAAEVPFEVHDLTIAAVAQADTELPSGSS